MGRKVAKVLVKKVLKRNDYRFYYRALIITDTLINTSTVTKLRCNNINIFLMTRNNRVIYSKIY